MARSPLTLKTAIAAFASFLLGLGPPLQQGPGCIAAVTAIPMGPVPSGQIVALTDGSIISPVTHFVSRTWDFGDGNSAQSVQPSDTTVTHAYVNATGQTRTFIVRLRERTGQGTCGTSLHVQVTPGGAH
jgi:hypothetical protein